MVNIFRFRFPLSYHQNNRQFILNVLPSPGNKYKKGKTEICKKIADKTGIPSEKVSDYLQTLKNQGLARCYKGRGWQRTLKSLK